MGGEQWKERVGGGTRDDFKVTEILESAKCADEITLAMEIVVANGFEPLVIKESKLVKRFFPMCAENFFFG